MHLQKAVDGYDVFARSLSIGAETMVMKFRPDEPMHDRYEVAHDFLSPEVGTEVVTISKLVNAFFRWEFNSCENLVAGSSVHPIDYANACPDVSLTSLHYYFPWAMSALVRWTTFCTVTGRTSRLDLDTAAYFSIADRDDLSYEDKLAGYRALADTYFETDRYRDFCASRLSHLDEVVLAGSPGPISTGSSSRRCGPRTRRTSTTGSSPTCADSSVCGCATTPPERSLSERTSILKGPCEQLLLRRRGRARA